MSSSKCETYYAPKYRKFIEDNFQVREWLKDRAVNTQKCYADNIRRFCEFANVTPEQFQNMDKKKARDIAWSFIETFSDKPTVAINVMAALKSFYRNHDGETLPFDSSKFGKHYVKPRARKASYEHVPTKNEVYQIIDMATSLRDRAMMLMLFQSGIRLNALLRLNYGHVREQLEKGIVPLHLKITDDLDTKLRGYDLPYYDTFVGKEAADALKRFCEIRHKNSTDDTPLFTSRNNNRVADTNVWFHTKRCMAHAGFDKRTMWVHSFRKAFKSELRKAPINEELSELLMGHRLRGSRESYMNRNDAVEELCEAYEQADFSRDGKTKETQHDLDAHLQTFGTDPKTHILKVRKAHDEAERDNEFMKI